MKSTHPIYASWPERLLAYLIDLFIIMLPVGMIAKPYIHENSDGMVVVEPEAYVVIFLVNLCYHTYFIASRAQATPGMRMLSIYVAHTTTRPLTMSDALQRFLAFFIPRLPSGASFISDAQKPAIYVFLMIVWFAPILFRRDRAGMHDQLCSTVVLARARG